MSTTKGLDKIGDCRMVNVTVPLIGRQAFQADGVLRQLSPPQLEIQFPPPTLPLDRIDPAGTWRISFDQGISFLTVWAEFARTLNPNLVELTITHSETNSHIRRDQRVDTEIFLRFWQGGDNRHGLKPLRTRVNLSGYGISFQTGVSLAPNSLVELEMTLPGIKLETIQCLGRVVRATEKMAGDFDTAFDLVNISRDDVEKVIHFCMTEQFKNMQSKARILAATLQPFTEDPPV
jgi:hypothetical protein